MISNIKLAQILQEPRAWSQVEILESELRAVMVWVIEYMALPRESKQAVKNIIDEWKTGTGPGCEED